MALWHHNGMSTYKVAWHGAGHGSTALLCGTAESLNTLKDQEINRKGVTIFGLNHSFRVIRPDIWMGLDKPVFFGLELVNESFPKVFGGQHAKTVDNGIEYKNMFNTYWADLAPNTQEQVFCNNGVDTMFWWNSSTFYFALHFIFWMGFRKIAFIGVDMKGDYFDKRDLNDAQKKDNKDYLYQNFEFMKWYVPAAKSHGMSLVCCCKDSKLVDIMPYQEINTIGVKA